MFVLCTICLSIDHESRHLVCILLVHYRYSVSSIPGCSPCMAHIISMSSHYQCHIEIRPAVFLSPFAHRGCYWKSSWKTITASLSLRIIPNCISPILFHQFRTRAAIAKFDHHLCDIDDRTAASSFKGAAIKLRTSFICRLRSIAYTYGF